MSRAQRLWLFYLMLESMKPRQIVNKITRHVHQTGGGLGVHGSEQHTSLVSDHGSLSGLSDDDHSQYLLVDGTRAMTDNSLYFPGGRLRMHNSAPYLYVETAAGGSTGRIYVQRIYVSAYSYNAAFGSVNETNQFNTYAGVAGNTVFQGYGTGSFVQHAKLAPNNFELTNGKLTGALDCNSQNLTSCGNVTLDSQKMLTIGVYTDAQRPAAGTAGRLIFNSDDGHLNVDDGTDWRDMAGNIT